MGKLEETYLMIHDMTKLTELGINVDNIAVLLDIAKSLAMIADKLCGTESENKE